MRPTLDRTMLAMAQVLSARATCRKLAVGCVLVDARGRIIGTGYNGVPSSMVHCTDVACSGATMPAGSDTCEAIHAEQNALLGCSDPWAIEKCYVTHGPCLRCTKLLLNTSCRHLVLGASWEDASAKRLWQLGGGNWIWHNVLEEL